MIAGVARKPQHDHDNCSEHAADLSSSVCESSFRARLRAGAFFRNFIGKLLRPRPMCIRLLRRRTERRQLPG